MNEYAAKHRAPEHELIDLVGWVEILGDNGDPVLDEEYYEGVLSVQHLN
jgi:hypothetical protein